MGVLLLLAGAAAACERVNPGFKLKDTSDDQGEVTSLSTSSVSGPTVTSDTGMTATTVDEPTTTSEPTLADPSTTTGAPTSDTETTVDLTTGGNVAFPTDCQTPVEGAFEVALVDTFLVSEEPAGQGCTLNGDEITFCRDLDFSKSLGHDIFLQKDLNEEPLKDLISLYAVRFEKPQVKYTNLGPGLEAYEGMPVKPQSWVGATVQVHVFRPEDAAQWTKMDLWALRLSEGDVWEQGNGAETECLNPAASFRCRKCTAGEGMCAASWNKANDVQKPLPYVYPMDPVALFKLEVDPGDASLPVEFDLPAEAVRVDDQPDGWLLQEGILLVPAPTVLPKVIAVHAAEAMKEELKPKLLIKYCDPVLEP